MAVCKTLSENQDIITLVLLAVILIGTILQVDEAVLSSLLAFLFGKYGIEAVRKRKYVRRK